MGVIPERRDFKNCPKDLFETFAAAVTERGLCQRVSFTPASEKSSFDTMGLSHGTRRVTLVYDNRAHILSVTAHDDVLPALVDLFNSLARPANNPRQQGPAQANSPRQTNNGANSKQNGASTKQNGENYKQNGAKQSGGANTKQNGTNAKQKTNAAKQSAGPANSAQKQQANAKQNGANSKQNGANSKQNNANNTNANSKQNGANSKPGSKQNSPKQNNNNSNNSANSNTNTNNNNNPTNATSANNSGPKPANTGSKAGQPRTKTKTVSPAADKQKAAESDESGGFSIKKFTPERFDALLDKIRADKKKYKLSDDGTLDKGKATELRGYVVTGFGGQKLKLRFMPRKQVLSLQGRRENLFDELKLLAAEQTDYSAAVDAHIELTGESHKRSAALERQLKKLLPAAFNYLSKESKTEFTIGVMEIINSSARHYDYSMLLLAPFRGLERLIFDLQRAQGVVVKMIGQAYEKEDGEYVLKASYRRRIGSVVYAEVMASLYRLYSAERNYYAHTDNTAAGEARRIVDRAQVSAVFQKILTTVEYNCKKLSEIGFAI